MNGTTYIEELLKDWDIHHGIYVDIFILHNCPNNKIQQLWQCFWAKCAVVKGLSLKGYNRHKGFRKFLIWLAGLLPRKIMVDFALSQVYKYRNAKSDYYCNFLGKAVFKKGLYKKAWFEKTEYIPFEKTELRVPVGLHDFLTERFGDYMIPPSEERIKWEQHALLWDTEKHFREDIESVSFADEQLLV